MPYNDESRKILELIYKKAVDDVDIMTSYHHYLVFGEIKVVYKDKEQK